MAVRAGAGGRLVALQFVDDLLDIKDDRSLGIYTLALYDLERKNLDEYVYMTVKKIDSLGPVYNFFKVILMYSVVLAIHDNPGCISEQLFKMMEKYIPFKEGTTKESLIQWFHRELYSCISEKNIDIKNFDKK